MTRSITICSHILNLCACAIVLLCTGVTYGGSISGRVTDANNNPLPAVEMVVYEYPPEDEDELASAITNSNGQYSFTGLADGNYMVAACPGCTGLYYINSIYPGVTNYLDAHPITVAGAGAINGINLQLAPSGAITGTVTDELGSPIAGMWIAADNYDIEEEMFSDALTNAQGVYVMTGLPPGDYRLETDVSESHLPYAGEYYNNTTDRWAANRVSLLGTETVTGIDFVLSPGGIVSGTVRDTHGVGIEDLTVGAMGYYTDGWFGEGETDANGDYQIVLAESGTYRIKACASCRDLPYADEFYNNADWKNASPVTVTVPQTTSEIDFVLEPGASISGFVYGWDAGTGEYVPVASAELSAENLTTGSCCGWAQTESDGSYTMGGLSAGSYRIRASATAYSQEYYPDSVDWGGAVPVDIAPGQNAEEINFELDLGGQIEGTVLDEDTHQPITENVWVNASPATGEPWGTGTNQIGIDGNYVITGLPSGTYKVSVQATGYDQEMFDNVIDWMMATPVTVAVGQTTSGINLTPKRETGGRMFGQVTLPDGTPVSSAHVNAGAVENMRWKWDDTEPNGCFILTGITPGQWRLRAQPPFGQDYVNYSESEEIIITMPQGANEVNAGQVILPVVNLVGQVKLPDGNVASWAPVNIEKLDWSFFTFAQTDQGGYFRKGGLDTGTYRIRLEIPCGMSGIVRPDPCIIEIVNPDVVLGIGVITYGTATKHITGQVQREGGEGVANVQVNCWKRGSEGWANTQTNTDGSFALDVASGTWEMMIHPSPQQQQSGTDWVYTGYPEVVTFTDDSSEETKTVTFTVTSANSQITGRVLGPNGESLRQGAGWIDIKDDSGKGNGVPMGNGGEFIVSVKAGTYNIWVGVDRQTYPYWSCPQLAPVKVEDGQTVNLGEIRLVAKNSGIQGQVTRSGDGQPISGVRVNAWQRQGGWSDTTTNEQGNYQLSLLAGTWDICAEAPYTSEYISGQPPRTVVVADGQIVPGINFQLQQASGSIALSLFDGEGALLTDIDGGWACAREDEFSMQPVAGSPINNGQATIKLPAGTYIVGVFLPPNTGYTMLGEQDVTVEQSEVAVNITLLGNNSAIMGGFFIDANKTTPATGIQGEVFAMQKMGGVWQSTPINSSDGSYLLRVAPGEWNLGYWIRTSGYINNPPPDSRVTIGSGETKPYDFVLIGADATIQGRVLDPDGNSLNHAWVWAHSEGDGSPCSRIDNGSQTMEPDASFTINVPSGREYEVGSNAPSNWGYIQPDFARVTPASGQTVNVTLRYKQSDASVTGNVYYKDANDENMPCEWAWVNAWSDNGQHTGTGANEEGGFQLNVSRGTTWHLEAFYHPKEDFTFFRARRPVDVTVSSALNTANIEVSQFDRELPPPISATFDPNVGWTNTLEDGTRIEIPAGAIPADDNVCISFSPMVDELQRTATDKPIGWGYAISISEQSTGNAITDNFNTNVLITFAYRDEDLAEEGLTEDDISPAYYSTTTDSWTKVESFTVDKDANTVTVQVNHFSTWALTSKKFQSGDDEPQAVDLTITKCVVKAGKIQGQDSFDASGTFAQSPPDLNFVTSIEVNIVDVCDEDTIYEESISFNSSQVVRGKYKYKGSTEHITSLAIDFNKKTFALKSKNIDLTGLGAPLRLNATLGSYTLSGNADETIVNGAKKLIPIRLMRTHDDTLRITSAKAKNSTVDSFTVKGELAVEAVDTTDLTDEAVTLTWGEQTFVIPAGSMVQKKATNKAYTFSKVTLSEGGIANGKFDLDKCTFNITVKNATLNVTTGAVVFGISFADFDETATLNLP